MIYLPALNLFLYNLLLVYLVRRIKRIGNDSVQVQPTNDSGSLWDYVPLVGDHKPGKDLPVNQTWEDHQISMGLLKLNIAINVLLLMPLVIKNIRLTLLLGVVITWNIFVLERVLTFQLVLVWSLWFSKITRLYYATLIVVFLTSDLVHLKLILQTMKLQRSCFFFTVQWDRNAADVVARRGGGVPVPIEGPIGDM